MGLYINPKEGTKELWLSQNGLVADMVPGRHRFGENLVVCLVRNASWTAAGVAYSQRELVRFAQDCGRPKMWFLVPERRIREVCKGDNMLELIE